jgi:hypothetical protein
MIKSPNKLINSIQAKHKIEIQGENEGRGIQLLKRLAVA